MIEEPQTYKNSVRPRLFALNRFLREKFWRIKITGSPTGLRDIDDQLAGD